MPSEETNLSNNLNVVFKERKKKRWKRRSEKKPSEEALVLLMSFFMSKQQNLHYTWQNHWHRQYILVTGLKTVGGEMSPEKDCWCCNNFSRVLQNGWSAARVQFDTSIVRCVHPWEMEMNTGGEIPYLNAPLNYSLFIFYSCNFYLFINIIFN